MDSAGRELRPELRLELHLERVAAAAILAALVAFSLQRVSVVDVPWHLATARLARAIGHWPVRNSFSYTFPEHPLYQQYPAFQAVLFGVFERWGWSGLSILECLAWVTVFLLFVRWAGPFRLATSHPLLWAVALFAMQRRISLRPELFTMLALAGMLHALSAFARGRRWAIAAVPVIHLCWVESHQLFPLSLLVQGMFIVHLVLARRGGLGVDRTDAAVPIWPAALALLISGGLCLATPLGFDVVDGVARTARSLAARRGDVAEFERIWRYPYWLSLALAIAVPTALALWRARRIWSPFDVGLFLLSLALAVSAARGVLFLGLVGAAVCQRTAARVDAAGVPPLVAVRPDRLRLLRIEGALIAVVLAVGGIYHVAIQPQPGWEGAQFGVGRSRDGWADGAIAFLRAHPPPGRMMNVPWASGNALIWSLPDEPVFVDPRLESYPLEFLREIMDGYSDDARLAAVIDRYRPTWIFAERVHETVRKRLASLMGRGWEPVYRDAEIVILVRPGADTADYRAARRIELAPEAL